MAKKRMKPLIDRFIEAVDDGEYDERLEELIEVIATRFAWLESDDDGDDDSERPSLLPDYRYWWIVSKAEWGREGYDGELIHLIGAPSLAYYAELDGEHTVLAFPSLESSPSDEELAEGKQPLMPYWDPDGEGSELEWASDARLTVSDTPLRTNDDS